MTYLIPNPSFLWDVALGKQAGYSTIHKFGRNPTVGGTLEDVWTNSAAYTYIADADGTQPMEINSGSALDADPAGTGARKIQVEGLDGSYDIQTEIVNLNGAGFVALANNYIRIHRMYVTEAGSTGSNQGLLTLRTTVAATPATTLQAEIVANRNQTEMCQFTIPNATSGLLLDMWGSLTGGPGAAVGLDFTIFQRPFGGVFRELLYREIWLTGQNNFQHVMPIPIAFAAKTDVTLRAATTTGTEAASGGYTLVLADD